jgi:hypothetical protein
MTEPGESLKLKYDRCLKPRFIGGVKSSYGAAIEAKHRISTAQVLERLRIDVYLLEHGHVERKQQVLSKSFTRVPGAH